MNFRVAKVPGSKWRLADWYVAHLPATAVYLEPYFGSGAVLFRRLVTYTLTSESGASLRAAGWLCYGPAGGGTWDRTSRARCDKAPTGIKLRWQQEATT